ncbi:MAG: hypothetical protein JXA20_02320 [Spirochaetes bacterium]|nr:hypothetical protein [Spirochaetota bacterium]
MKFSIQGIRQALTNFVRDLFGGFKKPGPFLIFDIATMLAGLLFFDLLARNFATVWVNTYLYAYIFFCFAIFLKRFDRSYLAGLEWVMRPGVSAWRVGVYFFVYLLSPVISGFAIGSFQQIVRMETPPIYIGMPMVLGILLLYPLIFALCAQRRAKPEIIGTLKERGAGQTLVRIVSGLGIYAMNLYLLTFVYHNIYRVQGEHIHWALKPVLLIAIALLYLLIYMPARVHYFIDAPQSRSNRAWFILSAVSMAVYTLFGISIL